MQETNSETVDKRVIVATCKDCKTTLSVDREEADRVKGFVINHSLMHEKDYTRLNGIGGATSNADVFSGLDQYLGIKR